MAGGSAIRKPLYLLAPVVAASAVRAARKILAGGGFDVVHAHWVVPNGPIGRLAAGATPLVVSMHGSDVAVSERSRAFGRVARWTFERAAAVTAPSRDLLSRARELGAREPLELVPYGADEVAVSPEAAPALRSRLGVAADDVLVVGLGRLVPVKGFDYLVQALAEASSEDPRLRLVLVGDGSERRALADRATSLRVADRVQLVGEVAHDAVPTFLAAADVVAVPSIRFEGLVDGLPNVALEAMAAGKPLVATRVGGLPELVQDGRNGVLVEERSATELASALLRLAGDADLRARLGAAARDEIRTERSWVTVACRFVEIYERAAATR
jgi:glycosyltransferase involved in cell wall biosynthesis